MYSGCNYLLSLKILFVYFFDCHPYFILQFLPHAHVRGVKQSVCLSVVVGTKIARSRVLGVCKHKQSCIFCSTCLWFIDHTHSFSMLMRLRMLKLCVGKGRQVIKQLCRRVLQYYIRYSGYRVRGVCALQSSSSFQLFLYLYSFKWDTPQEWPNAAPDQFLMAPDRVR